MKEAIYGFPCTENPHDFSLGTQDRVPKVREGDQVNYPIEIEKCSPEVRIRLYSLVNALRGERPPLMEDILWFAAYCEVDAKEPTDAA